MINNIFKKVLNQKDDFWQICVKSTFTFSCKKMITAKLGKIYRILQKIGSHLDYPGEKSFQKLRPPNRICRIHSKIAKFTLTQNFRRTYGNPIRKISSKYHYGMRMPVKLSYCHFLTELECPIFFIKNLCLCSVEVQNFRELRKILGQIGSTR